jgi:hypothetical protein
LPLIPQQHAAFQEATVYFSASSKDRALAPVGSELDVINDARVAAFLGVGAVVEPPADGNGNGSVPAEPRRRWFGGDGQLVAGRANRENSVLVINRPRDVWPWLARDREDKQPRQKGTLLLAVASFLVLLLAAGQGYVSWFAQYVFIYAAKRAHTPGSIEALGLDTGAVIFALLALALVRLKRRAIVPRILNVSCAAGSLAMNVLGADLSSPRSIAIYAMPSALYATASDQLVAVVRRHALPAKVDEEEQRSAWSLAWRGLVRTVCLITLVVLWVLRLPLYLLRLAIAPAETWGGLRQVLLTVTPLPEVEKPSAIENSNGGGGGGGGGNPRPRGRRRGGDRERRPTKKAALLKAYAGSVGYGDRSLIGQLSKDLAAVAGLSDGAARAYLYEFLNKTPAGDLAKVRAQLLDGAQ